MFNYSRNLDNARLTDLMGMVKIKIVMVIHGTLIIT